MMFRSSLDIALVTRLRQGRLVKQQFSRPDRYGKNVQAAQVAILVHSSTKS